MSIKSIVRTLIIVTGIASTSLAQAIPINGSVSFSDGFTSTGTSTYVVSGLNLIQVGGQTLAQGCTGDFPPPNCFSLGTYAFDFNISMGGGQLVFDYMGFEFHVTNFAAPTRNGLSCDSNGNCVDSLTFDATGYVLAPNYDATIFALRWTGQGGCTESANNPGECGSNVSASWSATATANGVPLSLVPEPGTLALIGLGLGLLGFVIQRRQT